MGQDLFNTLREKLGHGQRFVKDNVWTMLFLVVTIYLLREHVINPYIEEKKRGSARAQEKMKRARAEQQKMVQLKSDEAKKQRKLKKASEPKKSVASKTSSGGRRLGFSSDCRTQKSVSYYNPMEPSTASSGSSYRPARRSANRGGGG